MIRERVDEIGAVMTAEQGKPLAEARGEVDYAASFLEWFAGEAERVYGQIVPPMKAENRVLVLRQAVGVTAADHAVELPRRDDDPQARPGHGRGLHERRQAGVGDAADRRRSCCAPWRTPARRRASSTSSRRAPSGMVAETLLDRPRACASSRSRARPRSARS